MLVVARSGSHETLNADLLKPKPSGLQHPGTRGGVLCVAKCSITPR